MYQRPDVIFVCLSTELVIIIPCVFFLCSKNEQVFFLFLSVQSAWMGVKSRTINYVCLFDSFLFPHYSCYKFCLCRFGHHLTSGITMTPRKQLTNNTNKLDNNKDVMRFQEETEQRIKLIHIWNVRQKCFIFRNKHIHITVCHREYFLSSCWCSMHCVSCESTHNKKKIETETRTKKIYDKQSFTLTGSRFDQIKNP